MVLLDFGNAFPSLAVSFLQATLLRAGFDGGLYQLIVGMCWLPAAFVAVEGVLAHIMHVIAGIAQGCPLGGSLWAVAMNPLVLHMESIICSFASSALGVCAGD
eukprot:6398753-Pyramimonas_sp.AAC.1